MEGRGADRAADRARLQSAGKPQVVTISHCLPFESVPHAGGRYLNLLAESLADEDLEQCYLVPSTPSTRAAVGRPGCPRHLILGAPGGDGTAWRAARRALAVTDANRRRIDPGLPDPSLAIGLSRGEARSLLRGAAVVDLQWSDSIRLADRVHRLAPAARLVGTFHDVESQQFEREARRPGQNRPRSWYARANWARRWEERAVRRLDDVVVFSDKDADLLPAGKAHIHVVPPPLARGVVPTHVQPAAPVVLMVSYLAREENRDAACWLLGEIWPAVSQSNPGARLVLAGAGADAGLRRLAAEADAELLGYVDDLDALYAAASVAVVPLRIGAGVKFKTIEALVAGVPVVATPVGAEGVGDRDRLGALPLSAEELVDALNAALADPPGAQARADSLQTWAVIEFGMDGFRRRLKEIYCRPRFWAGGPTS